MNKKVFVSGCFDMLHSGHVAFLEAASQFGDLYVGIGSDDTVFNLKGRYPINNQDERKYMIEALKCVTKCIVNKGSGLLDFTHELEMIKPDVFVVNEDGSSPAKEELMKKLSIEYIVLERIPHANLPRRSTTSLRKECNIPYRIDLAGGWLDQPYVNEYFPGSVITISIEPTIEFNERSGMATSTRRNAIKLWQTDIPAGNKQELAKVLFSYENPPGTKYVSGSQDAIGIVFPGLNKLYYPNKEYWPSEIIPINEEPVLSWLENNLYLVTLEPREMKYNVLDNTNIKLENAKALADAADKCWNSILNCDIKNFGMAFRESFEAQIKMFPNMADQTILNTIEKYKSSALGWKLSGAGGGGYLILVSDKPVQAAIKIKIRRKSILS